MATERRHINDRTGVVIDDPHVRPFADWLRDQSQGATHDELSEALYDLVDRVTDTGKKGTLTLTISVEPMKGDDSVLLVSDEIKLRLPEYPRRPSIFYQDGEGNLCRTNPDQPELAGLREVPNPEPATPTTIKEAR